MKSEVSLQLEAMEGIVRSNLKECCAEIENWQVHCVLKDGFVRKAAAMLTDEVFREHQLVHVKNCVNRLARTFVIAH